MIAKVYSQAILGLDAYEVMVEVDITDSQDFFFGVVGLPDAAVRESRERVQSALGNSGYPMPKKRILVNLAPADIKKEGAALDLPIALGILAAQGRLNTVDLDQYAFVGELGLDGRIKPATGALILAEGARQTGRQALVAPPEMCEQAAVAQGVKIFPTTTLGEAVAFVNGEHKVPPKTVDLKTIYHDSSQNADDFADVRGQQLAKRGMEIAAAALNTGSPAAPCLSSVL